MLKRLHQLLTGKYWINVHDFYPDPDEDPEGKNVFYMYSVETETEPDERGRVWLAASGLYDTKIAALFAFLTNKCVFEE